MIADWQPPGVAWRLLLVAAISTVTLLLTFYAVRQVGVAVAMFLLFLILRSGWRSLRRDSCVCRVIRSSGQPWVSPSPV